MKVVIRSAVDGGPEDIFKVTTYESESTDPYKFVGLGHVDGGEATVMHNGASGNCRFIGDKHHPVFLDGILSGAFKSALDGVREAKNIKAVAKASKTQIAATLIKEVESGTLAVESSTPVKQGAISADEATTFLNGRAACKEFITSSSNRFSILRVLRFAGRLTVPLFVFYLLVNTLSSAGPHNQGTGSGRLGLSALLLEFGDVIQAFFDEISYSWSSLIDSYNPFPLLAYAVMGWLTARFFGPVLFPIAFQKFNKDDGRVQVLAPFGMLLASVLMALYPNVTYVFSFSDLLSVWSQGFISDSFGFTITLIPQIFLLSLLVALVRYKTAGAHWATRMHRKLQPS
jgi:hypothetical protein